MHRYNLRLQLIQIVKSCKTSQRRHIQTKPALGNQEKKERTRSLLVTKEIKFWEERQRAKNISFLHTVRNALLPNTNSKDEKHESNNNSRTVNMKDVDNALLMSLKKAPSALQKEIRDICTNPAPKTPISVPKHEQIVSLLSKTENLDDLHLCLRAMALARWLGNPPSSGISQLFLDRTISLHLDDDLGGRFDADKLLALNRIILDAMSLDYSCCLMMEIEQFAFLINRLSAYKYNGMGDNLMALIASVWQYARKCGEFIDITDKTTEEKIYSFLAECKDDAQPQFFTLEEKNKAI